MAPTKSATTVVTGKVRLSFVHLFEPYSSEEGQEPKYSVMLLIPKTDKETIRKIRAAQDAAKEDGKSKYWKGKVPSNFKDTLRDGDTEGDLDRYPELAGNYFMNVNNKRRVGLVDRQLNPILEPMDLYSGCYARVSLNAFPFSAKGNNGVSFGLRNVQKLADGEPLGGLTRAEDDFDALDDEEDGADLL